jgi:ankyrin repeat protein
MEDTLVSENDHSEVIKYLIERGIDFRAKGNYAVRYALYHGHSEVLKYLIESGAEFIIDNNYAVGSS